MEKYVSLLNLDYVCGLFEYGRVIIGVGLVGVFMVILAVVVRSMSSEVGVRHIFFITSDILIGNYCAFGDETLLDLRFLIFFVDFWPMMGPFRVKGYSLTIILTCLAY